MSYTSAPPTRQRSLLFESLLNVRHSLPTSTTLRKGGTVTVTDNAV